MKTVNEILALVAAQKMSAEDAGKAIALLNSPFKVDGKGFILLPGLKTKIKAGEFASVLALAEKKDEIASIEKSYLDQFAVIKSDGSKTVIEDTDEKAPEAGADLNAVVAGALTELTGDAPAAKAA